MEVTRAVEGVDVILSFTHLKTQSPSEVLGIRQFHREKKEKINEPKEREGTDNRDASSIASVDISTG